MHEELVATASTCASNATSSGSWSRNGHVHGVEVNGRTINAPAVDLELESQSDDLATGGRAPFRSRTSSTRPRPCGSTIPAARSTWPSSPASSIDEACGDLLFSSTARIFRTELLLEPRHHQPHVFVLLPAHTPRAATACLIVSSTNANYDDWANL